MCGRKVERKVVRQETIHAVPSNKTTKPLPTKAKTSEDNTRNQGNQVKSVGANRGSQQGYCPCVKSLDLLK